MKILQTGHVERSFGDDPTNISEAQITLCRSVKVCAGPP